MFIAIGNEVKLTTSLFALRHEIEFKRLFQLPSNLGAKFEINPIIMALRIWRNKLIGRFYFGSVFAFFITSGVTLPFLESFNVLLYSTTVGLIYGVICSLLHRNPFNPLWGAEQMSRGSQ